MPGTEENTAAILREVLDEWKAGIDGHDPQRVSDVFTEDAISWGPGRLDLEQIERARGMFALSYGSCSFDEPVGELKGLGLV